jgi:ankyrin repeat protein
VDADAKYKSGWTPLSLATRYLYTEVVKLLLGMKEGDVNAENDNC